MFSGGDTTVASTAPPFSAAIQTGASGALTPAIPTRTRAGGAWLAPPSAGRALLGGSAAGPDPDADGAEAGDAQPAIRRMASATRHRQRRAEAACGMRAP